MNDKAQMTKRFILAVVMLSFVRPAWRFLVFPWAAFGRLHGEGAPWARQRARV